MPPNHIDAGGVKAVFRNLNETNCNHCIIELVILPYGKHKIYKIVTIYKKVRPTGAQGIKMPDALSGGKWADENIKLVSGRGTLHCGI
jgi:hypothetical protein